MGICLYSFMPHGLQSKMSEWMDTPSTVMTTRAPAVHRIVLAWSSACRGMQHSCSDGRTDGLGWTGSPASPQIIFNVRKSPRLGKQKGFEIY